MIKILSTCHLPIEVLYWGMGKFHQTNRERPDHSWSLLNNKWPLCDADFYAEAICALAKGVRGEVWNADQNLGGTGGINYLLDVANVEPEDFVLWYDLDSNPVTPNWLQAMYSVMQEDPSLAVLSLMPPFGLEQPETLSEHKTAFHSVITSSRPQMFSVAMWRGSFILPKVEAEFKWYGQIEIPAFNKASKLGMRIGYLKDFKEEPCPIKPNPMYVAWKMKHVSGLYNKNFCDYVEEFTPKVSK